MKNLSRPFSLLVIAMVFGACGGGKMLKFNGPDSTVGKDGVFKFQVFWIKDKKSKFDAGVAVRNETSENLIVMLGDMTCFRGEQPGSLTHTFFNTGERTIDLGPGQMKTFNLVCKTVEKVTGDFKFKIARVFDNPSNDRKTTGKVLAENIEWIGQ